MVEPIAHDAFEVLVDLAEPAPIAPASSAMPMGAVADEQTTVNVHATVRQLVACINANDHFRELALYTNRYLLQELAGAGSTEVTADTYGEDDILMSCPSSRPNAATS